MRKLVCAGCISRKFRKPQTLNLRPSCSLPSKRPVPPQSLHGKICKLTPKVCFHHKSGHIRCPHIPAAFFRLMPSIPLWRASYWGSLLNLTLHPSRPRFLSQLWRITVPLSDLSGFGQEPTRIFPFRKFQQCQNDWYRTQDIFEPFSCFIRKLQQSDW